MSFWAFACGPPPGRTSRSRAGRSLVACRPTVRLESRAVWMGGAKLAGTGGLTSSRSRLPRRGPVARRRARFFLPGEPSERRARRDAVVGQRGDTPRAIAITELEAIRLARPPALDALTLIVTATHTVGCAPRAVPTVPRPQKSRCTPSPDGWLAGPCRQRGERCEGDAGDGSPRPARVATRACRPAHCSREGGSPAVQLEARSGRSDIEAILPLTIILPISLRRLLCTAIRIENGRTGRTDSFSRTGSGAERPPRRISQRGVPGTDRCRS